MMLLMDFVANSEAEVIMFDVNMATGCPLNVERDSQCDEMHRRLEQKWNGSKRSYDTGKKRLVEKEGGGGGGRGDHYCEGHLNYVFN